MKNLVLRLQKNIAFWLNEGTKKIAFWMNINLLKLAPKIGSNLIKKIKFVE